MALLSLELERVLPIRLNEEKNSCFVFARPTKGAEIALLAGWAGAGATHPTLTKRRSWHFSGAGRRSLRTLTPGFEPPGPEIGGRLSPLPRLHACVGQGTVGTGRVSTTVSVFQTRLDHPRAWGYARTVIS